MTFTERLRADLTLNQVLWLSQNNLIEPNQDEDPSSSNYWRATKKAIALRNHGPDQLVFLAQQGARR